jgi:hypothetical protein
VELLPCKHAYLRSRYRLLYRCFFRSCCLATGLRAAVYSYIYEVSQCLINSAPRHEDMGGSEGIAVPFVTFAVSDQLHAPATLPGERVSNTHWKWGCMGSRAGVDAVEKRRMFCLLQESNLGRPARSYPVSFCTLCMCWFVFLLFPVFYRGHNKGTATLRNMTFVRALPSACGSTAIKAASCGTVSAHLFLIM